MALPGGIRINQYMCDSCGHQAISWAARCPKCAAYGFRPVRPEDLPPPPPELHLVPDPEPPDESDDDDGTAPIPICDIEEKPLVRERTGFPQIDAVLGGGLVQGTLLVFGAEAGQGKSTLTIQIADKIALKTLYATGEEAIERVRDRAARVDALSRRVLMLAETDIDRILRHATKAKAELLVIDSIQTLVDRRFPSAAGSPTQVVECIKKLMAFRDASIAAGNGISIWVIGHVTGEGELAGTTALRHFVDVVLWMEAVDETVRIVRTRIKNRFGAPGARARLRMTNEGFVEAPVEVEFFSDEEDERGNGMPDPDKNRR